MKIVLASRNKKKIKELEDLLAKHIPEIEVFSLDDIGFEGEIENQPALLFSANRALKSIAALVPAYGSITLIQRVFTPLSHIPELNYIPGKEITVPLRGAVFSFKFSGAGTVTLKERHRVTPFFMDSPYTEFRKYLLDGEGELILSGNIAFTLKDIACFPYVLGTSEDDIPMIAPYRGYDMHAHVTDFFGFTALPTDARGCMIAGSYFRDATLYIPDDYEGEIHLIYHRVPEQISADESSFFSSRSERSPTVIAVSLF